MSDIYEKFAICQCGEHAASFATLEDEPSVCFLTFWQAYHEAARWRDRLHDIWCILKRGHLYADELVLSRAEALRLGMTLLDWAMRKQKEAKGEDERHEVELHDA